MKNTFKVKFTHNKADFFTDDLQFIPQINSSIKIYGKEFKVINTIIDYDFEDNGELVKFIIELDKQNSPTNIEITNDKKARCINVWNQSNNNLTLGKEYVIVREEEDKFWIITDNNVRRHYRWNNTQFIIIN